jgi:subtilisin
MPAAFSAASPSTLPRQIIVFREGVLDSAEVLARVLGTGPTGRLEQRSSLTTLGPPGAARARVYRTLGVAVATLSETQISELLANQGVLEVVPDQRRSLPMLPEVGTDTAAAHTCADSPLGQIGLRSGAGQPSGRGARVAVIDTGVDLTHPDLRVLPGHAVSFVPGKPDVQDRHGHGTHCAGVIAGRADPGCGLRYGVAPDATLLIAKALDQYGHGTDSQIIDAIDWAADLGAEIISLSLGSPRAAGEAASVRYERIASRLLERGVLLIAAAGNSSDRPAFIAPVGDPAACRSVLSVGALDQRGRVAGFSCGGHDGVSKIDLAAPGVGILSAWPLGLGAADQAGTDQAGSGYRRMSGTSMATPHVAGVAALYAELDSRLTGRALWDTLLSSARRPEGFQTSDIGAGLVQAPQS